MRRQSRTRSALAHRRRPKDRKSYELKKGPVAHLTGPEFREEFANVETDRVSNESQLSQN